MVLIVVLVIFLALCGLGVIGWKCYKVKSRTTGLFGGKGKNQNCNDNIAKNSRKNGFQLKDDEIFVIEDESNITVEVNNNPDKVPPMEMAIKKIELMKNALFKSQMFSLPKSTDEDDEEKSDNNASQLQAEGPGPDDMLATERDAI
ncbi:unnamed protein product [Moneuplotes crassus]|uniref:Uncharacterized protein n=1 Tax=Euplotes crassus TaxID=5936 RepID=A0AAD1XYZ5_EUPCR|nr:unnamed protein product [Moneuplotes crassus]